MSDFEQCIDILLVKIYRDLELLEEKMLSDSKLELSISEIHMLDAVKKAGTEEDGATISELSSFLAISLPSVTTTVNRLETRGFVERRRSREDGRVVRVYLAKKGRRAEHAHRYFHRAMVRELAAELREPERQALIKGVVTLDTFLQNKIENI